MMRGKATFAMLVLAGTVLSGCAADPGYDSSQFAYGYPVYQDAANGYPTYGYFDFDYWGGDWHRGWDHDHRRGGHH